MSHGEEFQRIVVDATHLEVECNSHSLSVGYS